MKFIVAIACVAIIASEVRLISTTSVLTQEQLASRANIIKTCALKNNVDEDTLSNIKKPEFEPTDEEKCFVSCVLDQWCPYGYYNDEQVNKAFKDCPESTKNVYEFVKCFEVRHGLTL